MNLRIAWVDALKGLGIILVVFGHTDISSAIRKYIYSFHMPLFFFCSGYLYSNTDTVRQLLQKKSRKLLLPYFLFTVLSLLIVIVKAILVDNLNNVYPLDLISQLFYINGKVCWNTPIWFLIVLFITNIVFDFIKRVRILNLTLTVLLLGLVGVMLNSQQIVLPFGLNIVCISITFYYLGYLSKKKYSSFQNVKFSNFLLVIIGCLHIAIGIFLNDRVDMYKLVYGNYILFYMTSILGIIFWIRLAQLIAYNKMLNYVGQATLTILGTHYFVFSFLTIIKRYLKITISSPSVFWGLIDTFAAILICVYIHKLVIIVKQNYKKIAV